MKGKAERQRGRLEGLNRRRKNTGKSSKDKYGLGRRRFGPDGVLETVKRYVIRKEGK